MASPTPANNARHVAAHTSRARPLARADIPTARHATSPDTAANARQSRAEPRPKAKTRAPQPPAASAAGRSIDSSGRTLKIRTVAAANAKPSRKRTALAKPSGSKSTPTIDPATSAQNSHPASGAATRDPLRSGMPRSTQPAMNAAAIVSAWPSGASAATSSKPFGGDASAIAKMKAATSLSSEMATSRTMIAAAWSTPSRSA